MYTHTVPPAAVLTIVRDLHAAGSRNVYDEACQAVERADIFPGADDPALPRYDERVHDAVMNADRIVRDERAATAETGV